MNTAKDLSTYNDLKEFLTHYGWLFDLTPEELGRRQLELVGAERFAAMEELDGSAQYTGFATAEEAHNYISTDSALALEVGSAMYSCLRSHLTQGTRVCDLGCFTGGYVTWLAKTHPECQFVGFDRSECAIRFARQLNRFENLQFELWDYSQPGLPACKPFDVLYTSFGIQFDTSLRTPGLSVSLDVTSLRNCSVYKAYFEECTQYFASWRAVAADSASLFLLARINCLEVFLAVLDAAAEARWQFDPSRRDQIEFDWQFFAVLTFRAISERPEAMDEEAAVDYGLSFLDPAPPAGPFEYDHGISQYLKMESRKVINTRTFEYPDGNRFQVEIGACKDQGYVLQRTNYGFTSLHYIGLKRLSKINLKVLTPRQLPLKPVY